MKRKHPALYYIECLFKLHELREDDEYDDILLDEMDKFSESFSDNMVRAMTLLSAALAEEKAS